MCENILKNLLNEQIRTEVIINWLKNERLEEDDFKHIMSYDCSQAEFILFFLNYLHDETSGILQSFSSQLTPSRLKTPRRIESFSSKSINHNNSRKCALFPEKDSNSSNNDINLGVSHLESTSKLINNSSQLSSTPKNNKLRSSFSTENSLLKDSLLSPISFSPNNLRNKSGNDLKNKSFIRSSSRIETTNLCLGDFMVQKKSSSSKQKKSKNYVGREINYSFNQSSNSFNLETSLNNSSINNNFNNKSIENILNVSKTNSQSSNSSKRRINPTNLTNLSTQDGGILNSKRITSQNSFSFQKLSETEISKENSRDILIEDRLKIMSRSKSNTINNIVDLPSRTRIPSLCTIQPKIESVTYKVQLESLAQIYSLLLDLNLVLNIFSELYFLVTLLLVQMDSNKINNHNDKEIEELRVTLQNSLTNIEVHNITGLFKTVHNCVYFATYVLNRQYNLLSALDRATLKLLQENVRLRSFAPALTKQLIIFHGKKIERKAEIFPTITGENVSFISDTDNRENFPTDSSFHTFRKQRDLFYELLRIWENNHVQSNWNFTLALSHKIKNLIIMHHDPANSMHLARLFKNQLIAECSQNTDPTPLPSCLNVLANVNAEKLSLLKNRLVSKESTGGPSPEPSFPGRQEFYKEFIIVCDNSGFHKHLIDCLVDEILQMDDTVFWPIDVEDNSSVEDPTLRNLFINSLKSLKVLAKFLGFIEAIPYKSEYPPNHQILTTQISVRKHFVASINVNKCLSEALKYGRLSLTIPWLTDYLAMLDHITLRLPFFSKIIETLFEIHYNAEHYLKHAIKLEQILMIKLSLGWLFERPNFPLDSYQYWITKKYQMLTNGEIVQNNFEIINNSDYLSIDCLDLFDENILFICCPFLNEIRNFLNSDPNLDINNGGPIKYIRPVSTCNQNSDLSNRRVQKQLEETFFHNQPTSTKKTIDLVSERVASACVKNICNTSVPEAKSQALNIYKKHLEHVENLKEIEINKTFSVCCMKNAKELSEKCFEEFKKQSKEEINKNVRVRCENGFKALLSDDVHPIIISTCISISVQQSLCKIEQWFSSHVNPGIFLKEFVSEMDSIKQNFSQNSKKISYKLPCKGKNVDHDPEAFSPVTLIISIRETMYNILEKPEEIKLENIIKLIENSNFTCQCRCDLNPVAQFMICKLFFDMFFMLATYRPDLTLESPLIEALIDFWNKFIVKHEKLTFFDRILCARNATMFEHSAEPQKTWLSCEKLLIQLMKTNMLRLENFEKQTLAMFQYEWPSDMVKYFSSCLQNIVDDYVKTNGNQNNFTFILSWIADYCNDDEFF